MPRGTLITEAGIPLEDISCVWAGGERFDFNAWGHVTSSHGWIKLHDDTLGMFERFIKISAIEAVDTNA